MSNNVERTPLEDLDIICEEIFQRWDADMRSGKLLLALSGKLSDYDPRVTRIREILKHARVEAG
jgi:hypothetical protein